MPCSRTISECLGCQRHKCLEDAFYFNGKAKWRHKVIYKLYLAGYLNYQIAEKCQCSEKTVSRVISRGNLYGNEEL